MKSEDVKDKSKKSELKKVLQLVLVILLGTGLITWIYHWQHSKVNSLSKQVSALQSQSASGVVKEQSVVENEEGGAPEGYELKSNKYFSFYWPKAWEDPEVKNEPASTVVGQRYSEDIVYNQDKSLWEEAGTYKSVEQPTILRKDQKLTVYDTGMGDAGCGLSTYTFIHKSMLHRMYLPVVCSVETAANGDLISDDKYDKQADTILFSISMN